MRLVLVVTAVLLTGFALLAAPSYQFTGDAERFVGLARAIADGASYSLNGRPEILVPPGLPLILAPAAWLFDGSFAAISRWAAALAALAFPLTWLYLRRREPRLALPVALLTVLSIPFLTIATDNPMSEPVFLALCLATFLWAEQREPRGIGGRRWTWIVAGCLLLVALPAVRTIGIAAVVAAALLPLADRLLPRPAAPRSRLSDLIPVAASGLFLACWFGWVSGHPAPWFTGDTRAGYLSEVLRANPHHPDLGMIPLSALVLRAVGNFSVQAAHAGELLLPVNWIKPSWHAPVLLLAPLLGLGWWKEFRGAGRFAALFFAGFLGIQLLWPYDEKARFLIPLVPLLWLYLLSGSRTVLAALRGGRPALRWPALVWAAGALLLLAVAERFSRQDAAALVFWLAVLLGASLGWRPLTRWAAAQNDDPGPAAPGHLPALVTAGLVALALLQVGPELWSRARGDPPRGAVARPLWEASRWIVGNTPPETVVQTTYEPRVHFATGRRVILLPVTAKPEPFLELERRYRPNLIVVIDADDRYYVPSDTARLALLKRLFPSRIELVHRFPGGSIHAYR